MTPKKKTRPYCKKCGRYLIGGKNGYCPEPHEWPDKQKLIKVCYERLGDYPASCKEAQKIREYIAELEHKYGEAQNN